MHHILRALVCAALAGLSTLAAAADPRGPYMPKGQVTSVPIGHYEFCRSWPEECSRVRELVASVALTPELWQQLVSINIAVNQAIAPAADQDQYRVEEYWTYPTTAGDCEDYALAKRKALVEAGWAPSTLLISVVRKQDGEGHAVLVARTDRGDLVLDNLVGSIMRWDETPYLFVKRQSQADFGQWVEILDHGPVETVAGH